MSDPVFWITGATGGIGQATAIRAECVGTGVLYAVGQPSHVDVNEIIVRPVGQGPTGDGIP